MHPDVREWLNLLVRMVHFISGIMWIGTSFYFVWLDSAFTPPTRPEHGLEGEAYLVHGGFFYRVEKRRFGAGEMPRTLHWFKWEATITWITGFLMLWIVYYTTNGAYLIDPAVLPLTPTAACAIGLGAIVLGWFVYDGLFRCPLANTKAIYPVAIGLVGAAMYGLTHVFSGRGAFIHLGAIFGTIMVLNVWVYILPSQRAIIRAAEAGVEPDYSLGLKAKRRSIHNSYLTLPVLFTMISNHFSSVTEAPYNWLALLAIAAAGSLVRHMMITARAWPIAPAVAAIGLAVYLSGSAPSLVETYARSAPVSYPQAHAIIEARCLRCHSPHPTDLDFTVAPLGVMLDTPERAKALSDRIFQRVVVLKSMPFLNRTGISDDEREILGRWVAQGAKIP